MKQLVIGLVTATLTGGLLVGVSAGTARAGDCGYTSGCGGTLTSVIVANDPVVRGTSAKICVRVRTAGSGRPKGRVDVVVRKRNGHDVFTGSKKYEGRARCFTTPELRRTGKYLVRAVFRPMRPSPFGGSTNSTVFRVVRSHH